MKLRLPDNSLFRIAAFLLASFLILIFLPRNKQNRFNFEENRPWNYTLLTAPFDIPVYLDSVSANAVRDSIARSFEPIYVRDTGIEKEMTALFSQRINALHSVDLTPQQRNRLIEGVKQIYSDGIVTPATYAEIHAGRLPAVRFIHDNVAITMPTTGFMSARAAYTRLDSLLREHNYRIALYQLKPSEMLKPNIVVDSAETQRLYYDLLQRAMAPIGVIQQGERIIDRGDIVTPQLATVLNTYLELAAERAQGTQVTLHYYPVVGQVMYIVLLVASLYFYLWSFRQRYFHDIRVATFLLLMLVGMTAAAFVTSASFTNGLYIVPITIVPIMVVIFLDSRTAMYMQMIQSMICAVMASLPLEFIFLQFIAGTIAIDSIKGLARRSQLIRTAFLVFIAYSLSYLAVETLLMGSAEKVSPRIFGYFGINAVFVSFAYVLLFIFEKIFGFTSRVTLVELSDINNPLLRELSEECPGTFQHSMAVSNLASAAASRIGANVQLVRAGALYHDIGKIKKPAFFTENQHGVNPHDLLDPLQSANIVISHVTDGLRMAEKAKLPTVIKDFISEHHGAGKARYFFTTWCNSHPDQEVDPRPFTYPGPNPRTRETSIIMMADAVEAASRSLKDNSPEAISVLVDKIINAQVNEGLHNDSTLSFHDVREIKTVFTQRLHTMFHSRISYPEPVKS